MCAVSHGCHSKNTVQIKLSAKSSCFIQNYPSASLFICLSERTSVCRTALLYDPAHFPLTFHFLYSHPVSGTTALCETVCCAVSVCSHWLVLCRGCCSYLSAPSCLLRLKCSIIVVNFYFKIFINHFQISLSQFSSFFY